MRKHRKSATKLLLATMILTATMGLTAYAADWRQDTTGWWYEQDGGGYATGWTWIDGKCYYFDSNGYMLANTEIDGYTLNADGQWTVDGIVQTQGAETGAVTGYNEEGISNIAIDLINSSRAEANAKYGPENAYIGGHSFSIFYSDIPFNVMWDLRSGHEQAWEQEPDNMDNYYISRVTCPKPSDMVNFLTSADDNKTPLEMIAYLKSKGYDAKGNNGYCYVTLGDYQVQFYTNRAQLNKATK